MDNYLDRLFTGSAEEFGCAVGGACVVCWRGGGGHCYCYCYCYLLLLLLFGVILFRGCAKTNGGRLFCLLFKPISTAASGCLAMMIDIIIIIIIISEEVVSNNRGGHWRGEYNGVLFIMEEKRGSLKRRVAHRWTKIGFCAFVLRARVDLEVF